MCFSRSHDAVIRAYDESGNVLWVSEIKLRIVAIMRAKPEPNLCFTATTVAVSPSQKRATYREPKRL
jgi:hypothetical protein